MARPPNIILCLADQLRAFELGCYGNPAIHTPNIDGLAADGARFAAAVTNYPVCMAARSVTLSGQYNRTCTGGVSNVAVAAADGRLNLPEYPFDGRPHLPTATLPELLHGLGYCNTAHRQVAHPFLAARCGIRRLPDPARAPRLLSPELHRKRRPRVRAAGLQRRLRGRAGGALSGANAAVRGSLSSSITTSPRPIAR